ncbi:hypothetical protein FGO68_gene15553 [Halteria grandinella]|uniref:Uncharacterized protein n=1 Tax=Halteria grandinella TaxID=5974 RepID=A0A8J8SUJ3_HALGN|nr:hypothetical protein FGO68_gene15553 [Halteria grandinella]
MLEFVRDFFGVSPERMHLEIRAMLNHTKMILARKGIKYQDLKAALTPQIHRKEIALIFDTINMTETWYGLPIHERLLPLLDKRSSRCILSGDYVGPPSAQDRLYEAFVENVTAIRPVDYIYSNQFYIVYLNNLSDEMAKTLVQGFLGFPPFVGFVDTTYSSRFKTFLSTAIGTTYLQNRNTVICGHEPDRDDLENVNIPGYPFQNHGFSLRSVPHDNFSVLLNYKIERQVSDGFHADTELSLNAVSSQPSRLSSCDIEVDSRKFDYLVREKAESLRGLGLLESDAVGLKKVIRQKIESTYIYNMAYTNDHDTTKFNMVIEVPAFKVLISLEYLTTPNKLRLITLF